MAKTKMVRVYCRTANISSPTSVHVKVRREAAERMVDGRIARWVLPDAIQRTEVTSEVVYDQPTTTDSECEINAGAYAGLRRGAAETLSPAQVEAVRRKVAAWPEIYDQKAPLPGYRRTFDSRSNVRGITLMNRDELQKLSDMQVAFIGSETGLPSYWLPKIRMRNMRDDFVLQHYGDDEPEPDSEATVGYHELDDSELEKWKRNFSCHDPPVCEWFFLPEAKEMTTQMTISGRISHLPATDRALELLTQEEAAVFLHKSPRVLRLWRTAGIGPAYVKLGKTVLYNRDDLITYVRSNTVQPSVRAAFEEENCGAL